MFLARRQPTVGGHHSPPRQPGRPGEDIADRTRRTGPSGPGRQPPIGDDPARFDPAHQVDDPLGELAYRDTIASAAPRCRQVLAVTSTSTAEP